VVGGPVLLYDARCGLCVGAVRFVLRRDRRQTLRFASLDGRFARDILSRHAWLRDHDTVVWYEPAGPQGRERVLIRSGAALEVLRYLGGRWRIGLAAAVLPRRFLDTLYTLVARSRRRLFGPPRECILPAPAERHRFLE